MAFLVGWGGKWSKKLCTFLSAPPPCYSCCSYCIRRFSHVICHFSRIVNVSVLVRLSQRSNAKFAR